ncbi:hypothetical protein FE257_001595 [Aspergillus nanangensis]|uniref:C2H2-type domain-containing protein n=1 Tax=Aspergillus nanangensis TaxID=2582783 RepID=A0AAD4CTL6_ASPNN|nr:hypothetical protein FE257_001595 [Aspergillus nanangensis]
MNGIRSRSDHRCHACNKTFSKAEHLTRHIRSHTKEKPYECAVCGKLYSRSDVLRRHERSHQSPSAESHAIVPDTSFSAAGDSVLLTPSSQPGPKPVGSIADHSHWLPHAVDSPGTQHVSGMDLHDAIPQGDSSTWFLGTDLDVDALDFSLSSAIFEWAQIPPTAPYQGYSTSGIDLSGMAVGSGTVESAPYPQGVHTKWFTYLSPSDDTRCTRPTRAPQGSIASGSVDADESYRAGLSRQLQPRTHDEALPSAEQLNLFARLFFSRFHSLFPVIHAPTFRPTAENSLLFLSICSIGSLFVGSSLAVAQGTRIFERLNKAILASWETILSRSRPDALSMVQAAILGQTFAILSGRPRDLVMADVLHGTVMSWARESNKYSNMNPIGANRIKLDLESQNLEEQWQTWIELEQRGRVEIALNIHDAELASLLHHDPIGKHRFSQYPCLESDILFMAPTAERWAAMYRQTAISTNADDPFRNAGIKSRFAAYAILESINADLIELRRSKTFTPHESQRISQLLIHWWRTHSAHLRDDEDPFGLPVLWHSVYMCLYVDMDLLEQAIGRCGNPTMAAASTRVQEWAASLDASKCLVHALLIQRYLERMRVSAEPAIHIPRSLFSAALAWICFNRIGCQQTVNLKAFDAPEIQLLGSQTAMQEAQGQAFGDSAFADVNHLHRLVDLLHRVGRWAISKTFASVLCAALEDGKGG